MDYAIHSILAMMAEITSEKILIVEDDRNLSDTLKDIATHFQYLPFKIYLINQKGT